MGQEYYDECKKAMNWLAKKKDTFFLGQTVEYPGSPMFASMADIPKSKKLELPLIEDDQLGMSTGLALNGFIPISIYPRIDFFIIAMNQLVNHLDKISQMSNGEFKPGVIIRTQIGNTKPLWPGLQHCGDYTEGLRAMLKNIEIFRLDEADEVLYYYKLAYKIAKSGRSVILVETPQGADEKTWNKIQNARSNN